MFYKALGFATWKGAKWYVHRKVDVGTGQKAALVAAASAALLVGAVIAGRQAASDD